jgi:hypothetical protein
MPRTTPITPEDERERRRKLRFPLSRAFDRHAAAIARSLERIAGTTIQVDKPNGGPFEYGAGDKKMRRKTDAEAHRMGVWFHDYFELDCRKADFLSQTAAQLREHIAELAEIADGIDAAAKRRQKVARARRAAS